MGSSRSWKADPGFPDDLVMEVLIRLPGKQVGRCKCVCKSWRSIIRSAHFKDLYGIRHRGLIIYRRLQCFVMDDDEGKRWNKHLREFPDELDQHEADFVVPNGSLCTDSAAELILFNRADNYSYCYSETRKMEARFRVGKPPEYSVDQRI